MVKFVNFTRVTPKNGFKSLDPVGHSTGLLRPAYLPLHGNNPLEYWRTANV